MTTLPVLWSGNETTCALAHQPSKRRGERSGNQVLRLVSRPLTRQEHRHKTGSGNCRG